MRGCGVGDVGVGRGAACITCLRRAGDGMFPETKLYLVFSTAGSDDECGRDGGGRLRM